MEEHIRGEMEKWGQKKGPDPKRAEKCFDGLRLLIQESYEFEKNIGGADESDSDEEENH